MFYLAVLTTALVACTSPQEEQATESEPKIIKADDFPRRSNLIGEQILVDYPHNNLGIDVTDSLLILTVIKDSVHFYVYGKYSLQKLGAVGVVGRGPNEWSGVFHSNQYEKSGDGINLWFSVSEEVGDFVKVNLTKTLATGSAKPFIAERIAIDAKNFPYTHLFYLNEEKIIGNTGYFEIEKVRIKSYNPKTKEINKSNIFPTINNAHNVPVQSMYNLYASTMRKHPSKELFVQTMWVFNRLDIFDGDLKLLRSAVAGANWQDNYLDGKNERLARGFTKDFVEGYGDTAVGEGFIYAINAPKVPSERSGRVETTEIKVFNWNAEPQCILTMANNLSSIAVDESEGYLYAVDYENEKVLRYNIKKQLETWKK